MNPTTSARPAGDRIESLDVVRGAVMVLMAIDHVRVYAGIPAGGPTAGIFFTRWVTHFCAPAFAFLAGTGAFLYGRKIGDPGKLAKYLLGRGALLVVLELTVIRASWTFRLDLGSSLFAGVIWMLGWSMIGLAGMARLRARTVGIVGIAVMAAQQILGVLPRALPEGARAAIAPYYNFLYPSGIDGWEGVVILYTIVPWVGVMAAGYGFGAIVVREEAARRKLCLWIGLGATALFILVTAIRTIAWPQEGDRLPPLFRALNPNKYPASQLFLLMTLGPTIALLPFLERARGALARALAIFGRVPMFYYLLHIPLIHAAALVVNLLRDGDAHSEWYVHAPFVWLPPGQQWGLPLLYLVFAIVVFVLYWPCLWFAGVKARGGGGWLRYL